MRFECIVMNAAGVAPLIEGGCRGAMSVVHMDVVF
jgi:hypothetical protein